MSLLSFTKCFIGAGGEQAAAALTTAMVNMSPEAATAAELKNMEQDLDAAGRLISQLQRELTDERHAYDAINARYTQMMGAAENLQHQIDAASFLKDPLQASLATLVAQIEEMVPELDQDKKDIDSTQALLTEAEFAYQAKATALREAKAKLTRAKNDMAHAAVEEQRAAWRAETARAVAGLSIGSGSGINVAVDAMTQTAQATRDRAAQRPPKKIRTSRRQWRRLPERLQMRRSLIGWRLCNSADSLAVYNDVIALRRQAEAASNKSAIPSPRTSVVNAHRQSKVTHSFASVKQITTSKKMPLAGLLLTGAD
jgi:chromosome segregation ATPase